MKRLATLALAVVLAASAAGAQTPAGRETRSESDTSEATATGRVRHVKRWWHLWRPAKDNAADQKAYADKLNADGQIRRATRAYRALVYTWPSAPEAPAAQSAYAELLRRRERLTEAFDEYQFLIETYAGFYPCEPALERQYEIARSLAETPHRFLFATWTESKRAIPLFEKILRNAPRWPRAAEIQYRIGRIRQEHGEYDRAIEAYTLVQQRYPGTVWAHEAAFGLVECHYALANDYPNSADMRQNAAAMLRDYMVRYPTSEHNARVRMLLAEINRAEAAELYRQARVYYHTLNQPRSAIMAYERLIKEYPDSAWAGPARTRIAQLERILARQER